MGDAQRAEHCSLFGDQRRRGVKEDIAAFDQRLMGKARVEAGIDTNNRLPVGQRILAHAAIDGDFVMLDRHFFDEFDVLKLIIKGGNKAA